MTNVSLKTNGNNCVMSNGILTIHWKEDGSVESLKKNGVELVKNLNGTSKDSNAKRTFYVDYHAQGKFHKLKVSRLDVIESTADVAHIAYIDTKGLLYIEYHILLKKGESGIYTYIVAKNNTDASFILAEFRTVYRFGNTIFDHGCNSERIGLQPSHKYMEQYECLQDETYRLPDGEKYTNGDTYSKYDYASYFNTNKAWGQYGHGFGIFIIPVSTEYYPGGPLKQELLVHYDGILLNYFTGSHFGTGDLLVTKDFEKFYGPFFVYINAEEDLNVKDEIDKGKCLYEDALNRALIEEKKWPFTWVNHSLYPLNRSKVSGQLLFADGTPCSNTTIVLGKEGGCFEQQSGHYIYSTTTEKDGYFQLPHVRFDTYSLYAYHTGQNITNQLAIDNIIISEEETNLNKILYQLPDRECIWQIGTATRTSSGFIYGNELRNYKWHTYVPDTLTFTIGESIASKDWYYAQSKIGTWNIKFTLENLENKNYYFIIAFSGVSKGYMTDKDEPYINIYCNTALVKEATFLNDSSVYRSSTTNGRYRRLEILLTKEQLNIGENILSIYNTNAMLMYDTLLLEKEK